MNPSISRWPLVALGSLPLLVASFHLSISAAHAQEPAPASASASDERAELLALLQKGDYSEAEDWYTEEPDAFPLLWARFLRETGRASEALAAIDKHPKFTAGDPEFLVVAGGIYHERGDLPKAKELLRKAVRADGNQVEARTRLGQVLHAEGKRDDATEQWKAVLSIYQEMTAKQVRESTPEVFVWMGKAAEGLGRYEEAYQVLYSTALDLEAGSVAAHVASGWLLYSKYNYPDARSHFTDALKTNPNHAEAHVGLARAINSDYAYPGERSSDTRMHLEQARQVYPNHPEAMMLAGDIAFYAEEWQAAEKSYRQGIEQNPADLWRKGRLAALFFATARLEEFEEYKSEVDGSKRNAAPFYGSLAERLVDRFFYVEAADFAQKAVELDPEYWPAYVVLGINALRAGRDEIGREYTKKAFEADPFNVWAYNTLQLIKRIDRTFVEKKNDDFVIRMPEAEAPFLMPYLEPLLYETRARMEREYKEPVTRPITVEDFAQHAYFSARSIGLPGLAASGVCFGRMVTLTTPNAIPGNWGAVAVHEFAHVVTLHKARHRIPRWFGEGLSVFEEGRGERRWSRIYAHDWVTAVHADRLLPMADIQKGFTAPTYPGQILISYYQGGAICDFIERDWGYDAILQMLDVYRSGKDTEQVFKEVLDISLPAFDKRFMKYARELSDSFTLGPQWPKEVIGKLRYHTEDHPKDATGWMKLAFAYYFNRRQADAELVMGTVETLDPENADLAALKGMIAFGEEKPRTCRREFEKAIAGGTMYPYRARIALALVETDEKNYDRAKELLREAIAMHPAGIVGYFGRPSAYKLLAALLDDEGAEAEAVEVLEALVKLDRDDFPTRMKLGAYYTQLEDWEKVIETAWDAPYIYPYEVDTHRILGRAYFETEAFKLAKREYEIMLAAEEPPVREVYPRLAYCHWKLGELAEAKKFANRAKSMTPDNALVREVLEALD